VNDVGLKKEHITAAMNASKTAAEIGLKPALRVDPVAVAELLHFARKPPSAAFDQLCLREDDRVLAAIAHPGFIGDPRAVRAAYAFGGDQATRDLLISLEDK
jgi:hypothetical protein